MVQEGSKMSLFQAPEDSLDWAKRKGIVAKCSKCGMHYDPNIGCKCQVKKPKLDIFKDIVWPK